MKQRRILSMALSFALCLTLLGGIAPKAQAESLRASIVTAPVTLNGQKIDNRSAQYPLLLYRNITYFPMTYHLSRFMGVTADWSESTRVLRIAATGERGPYVPDTGHGAKNGTVPVVRPTYDIILNDAYINNAVENWPILNYKSVTYFPLTYRFAADLFGWQYQWDAENGLRIDTSSVIVPNPTEPDTGSPALDAALVILNAEYLAERSVRGAISGEGEETTFTGRFTVYRQPDITQINFTADPFPFFPRGSGYSAVYIPQWGGLSGTPQLGYSGQGSLSDPLMVDETQEKVYIGECLMDCQFMGKRCEKITAYDLLSQKDGLSEWELSVAFERNGFTGYTARFTIDEGKHTVARLVIETEHYTLALSPA